MLRSNLLQANTVGGLGMATDGVLYNTVHRHVSLQYLYKAHTTKVLSSTTATFSPALSAEEFGITSTITTPL